MEKRRLGKTDLNVSILGFGGAEIGFQHATQETVDQLLGEAIDAGLNVIDSAAAYLESEKLIGNAIKGKRDSVYLLTKCGAIDGFARSDWSRIGILKTIEQSLANFQTDHVDCVFLHSCGEMEFAAGEAGKALLEAKEKGLTRYIGYSGDSGPALAAVQSGIFDVLETSINIADQEALSLTLPLAIKTGMGVVAKRPVANVAWKTGKRPENSYHHTYFDRLQKLDYPFLRSDLHSAVSTALRFTLSHLGVHTAIVGTTKPGRWSENSKMLEAGPLPEEEISAIHERWKSVSETSWIGQV